MLSRKIRAVNKAKGERGEHLTTNPPFGYVKDPENPKQWIVDEEAAKVVRHIFDLCMEGRGPMQIAKQLTEEKVLTITAYALKSGRKALGPEPADPCQSKHRNNRTRILNYSFRRSGSTRI